MCAFADRMFEDGTASNADVAWVSRVDSWEFFGGSRVKTWEFVWDSWELACGIRGNACGIRGSHLSKFTQ